MLWCGKWLGLAAGGCDVIRLSPKVAEEDNEEEKAGGVCACSQK